MRHLEGLPMPVDRMINRAMEGVSSELRATAIYTRFSLGSPANKVLLSLADEFDRRYPSKTTLLYAAEKVKPSGTK